MLPPKQLSHLLLSNARNRKYLLVITLFSLFSTVHSLFRRDASDDAVTSVALMLLYGWCAFRVACVMKNLLNRETITDTQSKAVLITGCSSGFGKELARRLDSLGFTVFAGCRNITDERAVSLQGSCSSRLQLVKLDVTSDLSVDGAVQYVTKHLDGKDLWAVVCNAGIFAPAGFDWGERHGVSLLTQILETNTIGAVRTINSFAPLLKRTPGSRIVITGSIAGHIPCPSQAAYSASKFALRGFASALRIECRKFNVHVALIEPIYYGTCLVEQKRIIQQLDDSWNDSADDVKDSYSTRDKDSVVTTLHTMLRLTHQDISPVIDALTRAVTCSREPDHHYRLCSWTEGILFYLNETLPSEITDDYLAPLLISPTVSLVTSINELCRKASASVDIFTRYRNKLSTD